MNAQLTDADFIAQYIKLRNYKAAEQEAFDARMKPYDDAMKTIEDWGAGRLNQIAGDDDGKASLATPQGTMYRKKTLSVKVADREAWFKFIFEADRDAFLTSAVSKEAVVEYMEQYKSTPPGVEIAWIRKTLFNSPKK